MPKTQLNKNPLNLVIIPGLVLLFLVSRVFILINQPEFSVVSHYYVPYAHAWQAGFIPYIKQLYEYGPYTIPLFYLPLILERILNLPYFLIYKGLLLLGDMVLLALLIHWLNQRPFKPFAKIISIIFVILSGLFLKDFYYDSYDLVFGGFWFLSVWAGYQGPERIKSWLSQFLFWVAVGLKYINLPLVLPYLFIYKNKFSQRVVISMLMFGLVWLAPIIKFQKSLLTTVTLHSGRGLQVESLPANLVRLVHGFTGSEGFAVNNNAVEIVGPLSARFGSVYTYLFPLLLGLVLVFIYLTVWKNRHQTNLKADFWLNLTLVYIFAFMALGKILSTPYLIWPILFLAARSWSTFKSQLIVLVWYLVVIYISANPIVNTDFDWINLHTIIGLVRGFSLIGLCFYFIKQTSYPDKT